MKKTLAILGAFLALAACSKKDMEPAVLPEEQDIVVNITISRTDVFEEDPGTRATVKSTWDDGDVVFVFFSRIAPPKYLEMKYQAGTWKATPKNGLTASDLSGATDKRMAGVFMPYGSDANVVASNGNFAFDLYYNGTFYRDTCVPYEYDDGELRGELRLSKPYIDIYVHFDVTGFTEGHSYALYQDHVSSLFFGDIGPDASSLSCSFDIGIAGHIDKKRGILSFSGIQELELAYGEPKALDYQFSIIDETASVIYTRDAGIRTIDQSTAVGLGDLQDASTWTATDFVYMGIDDANHHKLCWAKKNLGATAEKGEGSYGRFFAFGETTGYSLSGTFPVYACDHNFNTIPPYELDDDDLLKPEYDAAHATLKGLWRMPTRKDFEALSENATFSSSEEDTAESGSTVTSKVPGYGDKSIFLPTSGFFDGNDHFVAGSGVFLRSGEKSPESNCAYYLFVNIFSGYRTVHEIEMEYGIPIRPVFSVPSLDVGSQVSLYE